VSLLLAEGHPDAAKYPLGVLGNETAIVKQRLNRQYASVAVLQKMMIGAVLAGGEAAAAFNKQIKRLNDG